LIDQIHSGHKELFMDLIRPHQRTVYATVFALLANKEDAEDVAQDASLKALASPFESVSQRVELRYLADSDSYQ